MRRSEPPPLDAPPGIAEAPAPENYARRGRPFPTHTKLGQRALSSGYTAYQLAALTSVAPRTLTEYLAGRKPIAPHHMPDLCRVLRCKAEDLRGE